MRLMEYLPEGYENSRETVAYQEAIQPEAADLWTARDWFLAQLDPRTASGQGLALWEAGFGLHPAAGTALEQRRARVVAKIRGMGTVTAELIRTVVESFFVRDVQVRDLPRENMVEVGFTVGDSTPDIRGIIDALLEILPAHLGLGFNAVFDAPPAALAVGAACETSQTVEVWPRLIHEMDSGGALALGAVTEYHRTLEIYPKEVNAYA